MLTVKLRLAAVLDAKHGGFATGWSPISCGSIDELFVNLTMPAAVRFFRKLLKNQRHVPRRLITDKLRSYSAACRAVMPSVFHCTDQYANNRAEVSHQPTRQRECRMRRFTSAAQLQRFASVHGIVQNLFRVGRHLLRSAHHRLLRARELLRAGRERGAVAEDAVKVAGEDGRPALGVEGNLIERRALGVEHGVLPASWKERGV